MKLNTPKRLSQFLAISVLVHIFWVVSVFIFDEYSKVKKPEIVTLDLVQPLTEKQPTSLPDLAKQQKKNITLPKQQIVDQDEKPVNDEVPDQTRFLSKNNQVVKKQTVSINKGDFQNHKKGKISPQGLPQAPEENKNTQSLTAKPSRTDKDVEKSSVAKTKPTLKDLTPHFDALASMKRQEEQEKQKQASKGVFSSDSQAKDQASQSPDYLKDVDQGLETMLSTKEFKYYTYFNRIRRQLSQHWEPKVREKLSKLFKQGRSIASEEDKITKLVIILNPAGQLVKVQILSASGVNDLDDAAVEAFQSAAPFPNPPKGIIDPDGTVKIRWDFVLES